MSFEGNISKSSGFTSLFGRKKRINGAKEVTDEMKGATGAFISAVQPKQHNGFIDSAAVSEIDSTVSNSPYFSVGPSVESNKAIDFTRQSCNRNTSTSNYESNKEQRCYKSLKSSKSPRFGSIPLQVNTLPDRTKKSEITEENRLQEKSQSANAVYLARKDPNYLTEALETLAAEQPLVARSIPKHAIIDTSYYAKHSLDNCIFDESVYQAMLDDSLKTCQLLQEHLNECADYVRSQTPKITNTIHEIVDTGTTSLDSDENISQQTLVMSPAVGSKDTKNLSKNSNYVSGYMEMFIPDVPLTAP